MPDRTRFISPAPPAPRSDSGDFGQPHGIHFPVQPLLHLDELWIQVAGTECNLSCTHCFVSAGPGIDRHEQLSAVAVRGHVAEGVALGVKEFYFTGGEPFVNPEMLEILEETLRFGPCTVLTNGTVLSAQRIDALSALSGRARYALEIRVSLDGIEAADHDRFRGHGAFARTISGLLALDRHGLLPIVTLTYPADADVLAFRERASAVLRRAGLTRPRLKLLPMFQHGREAGRTRGYDATESLAGLGNAFDPERLQCSGCRCVTSQGVFVCPLLVDEPAARMGERLGHTLGAFELGHGACYTCWVTGMSCANG